MKLKLHDMDKDAYEALCSLAARNIETIIGTIVNLADNVPFLGFHNELKVGDTEYVYSFAVIREDHPNFREARQEMREAQKQ